MSSKNGSAKVSVREEFTSAEARALFTDNHLPGFAELWELEAPWCEAPNVRRNGQSGVVIHELRVAGGANQRVFIKRQQNHGTRTFLHPIRGLPTFDREYHSIRKFKAIGVPTVEPLYYGAAKSEGAWKAILVTRALDGYVPLQDYFSAPGHGSTPAAEAVLRGLVDAIRPMHRHHFSHGCLYGNHVFVKVSGNREAASAEIRLLDLEKVRRRASRHKIIEHDLSQLIRHTPALGDRECRSLLQYYFGAQEGQRWHARFASLIATRAK